MTGSAISLLPENADQMKIAKALQDIRANPAMIGLALIMIGSSISQLTNWNTALCRAQSVDNQELVSKAQGEIARTLAKTEKIVMTLVPEANDVIKSVMLLIKDAAQKQAVLAFDVGPRIL